MYSLGTMLRSFFSRQKNVANRVVNTTVVSCSNRYHSFPDKDEKPVITQTVSKEQKQLKKENGVFDLHNNFKMNAVFPGTPTSSGIGKDAPPLTRSTTLPNGITVASRDMPGLMSSFAVIMRVGG